MSVIPWKYENTPISLVLNKTAQKLSILIENQGRINYGSFIEDRKVSRYFNIPISVVQ